MTEVEVFFGRLQEATYINFATLPVISPLFYMVNRCVGDSSCVVIFCAHDAAEGSGLVLDNTLGGTVPTNPDP
jgi:hypothetical protein